MRNLRGVTSLGWWVLGIGLLALIVGRWGGYVELGVVGLACLFAWLLSLIVAWLPTSPSVELTLRPERTVAGQPVVARAEVSNRGRLALDAPIVRLPVGEISLFSRLGRVRSGESEQVTLEVPATRRGVVSVGPARLITSDPLGLFRRSAPLGRTIILWVRPRTVALGGLGLSQLRDLEGAPSDRLSMSDLAFHALREYVPGDDLRHVHWRSSARAGELLVRQYHDTRRSQLTVVLDTTAESYSSTDEFELAVSAAASLLAAAALEEYDVTFVAGARHLTGQSGPVMLDETCLVEREPSGDPARAGQGLSRGLRVALELAPDSALLLAVTGSLLPLGSAQDALAVSGSAVARLLVRADPSTSASVRQHRGVAVAGIAALTDLPVVLTGAATGVASVGSGGL